MEKNFTAQFGLARFFVRHQAFISGDYRHAVTLSNFTYLFRADINSAGRSRDASSVVYLGSLIFVISELELQKFFDLFALLIYGL